MHSLVRGGALAVLILGGPAEAEAAVVDGPGRYFMVRTLDTGREPSEEQSRRCREHFGSVREQTVFLELDAELFTFPVDPETGRVDDSRESLERVGPGFICAVPSPDGARVDTYAFARIEGETPEFELEGPCDLGPAAAQPGAAFFNCKLSVLPDLGKGVLGGFATSNSVLNPAEVPGNPTGSVWTFYLIEASR